MIDVKVLVSTFGLVFLAELGDKTQLTAMALATRYPWKRVFVGIAAAFAILNLGAVVAGKILFTLLPLFWIRIASGLLFLYFGISTLRSSGDDDTGEGFSGGRGPIATSFLMILLAELGDKTQIVTASLAAQHESQVSVFAGSTAALWSVSLLGIFLGRQIVRVVPLRRIHQAAAVLFLLFGIAILRSAFAGG
jgi:Ca2+/H+ antiporter, TMEM165/GDT1 family